MLDPCGRAEAGLRGIQQQMSPLIGNEQVQPLLDMNTLHVLNEQPLLRRSTVQGGAELTATCAHLHDRHGLAEGR